MLVANIYFLLSCDESYAKTSGYMVQYEYRCVEARRYMYAYVYASATAHHSGRGARTHGQAKDGTPISRWLLDKIRKQEMAHGH